MSTYKSPLVSVIIPTYNYAQYISEAIDSVLNSDFPQDEIEIIVIDDGSQDNTSEVVAAYESRVKYIFQENAGKAWATKIGIDCSTGKYLFNLDADDLFLPNKITEVVQIFEKNPDIVHVAHPALCWQVDKDKKSPELIPENVIGRKWFGRDLLTFFYRRSILFGGGSTFAGRMEAIRKFSIPKEVDIYIDEYLVMCTLNQGYSYFIDSPLSIWRIHGNNYSGILSNPDIYKAKIQRNLNSIEAILNSLVGFDQEILDLYALKFRVTYIFFQEKLGTKESSNIFNMWLFYLQKFNFLSYDSLLIIRSYKLLNRSLPISILKIFKFIKAKLK